MALVQMKIVNVNKMFEIDKMLGKKKSKSNNSFTNMTLSNTIGKNPISSLLKMTTQIPKKGAAPLYKQKQWASFPQQKRQQLRMKFKDTDGDRIPNAWDCQPKNIMRQDSQLYLKPSKQQSIFYTNPKNNSKKIFINQAKGITGETQEDIDMVSNLITHEEMHNLIHDEVGLKSSSALDSVTILPVHGNRDNIVNKHNAGLPATHREAKQFTYDALNSKIRKNPSPDDEYNQKNKNKHKVVTIYDKFHERSNTYNDKGASIKKQHEWRDMSGVQRDIQRQSKQDIDGDRIPDEYDCQPDNAMRQDFVLDRDSYNYDKKKFKLDDKRKIVMMPVEELYHKRGRYNMDSKSLVTDNWKEDEVIKQNIAKASGQDPMFISNEMVLKHKLKQRQEGLIAQGLKPSPPKLQRDEYGNPKSYLIHYRRSANKYKEDIDNLMKPANTDYSRSENIGEKMQKSGASNAQAHKAERMFHATSMRNAVFKDEALVPMVAMHGGDVYRGKTIGEGRHRILSARAVGMKYMPVFIEPNNRLPEGALDNYRELNDEEIRQYSPERRVPGRFDLSNNKVTPMDDREWAPRNYNTKQDVDIGYDEYKDKRTHEEKEQDDEIRLMLLERELLGDDYDD